MAVSDRSIFNIDLNRFKQEGENQMTLTRKFSFIGRIAFLILLAALAVAAASGDVDPTFNASVYTNTPSGATTLAVQADGKALVGGSFRVANGIARHGIVRLNQDGSTDTSFNPPDLLDPATGSLGGTVNSIVFQSNGKILVGGRFVVLGSTYRDLIRLNTDGSLDTTFANYSAQFANDEFISKIVVRPNDVIFIGGSFSIGTNSSARNTLAKLDANGAIDIGFTIAAFGGAARDFAVQPDEKVVVADVNVGRFNQDGSPDNSFTIAVTNAMIRRLVLQPDGKILVGGDFNNINGFLQGRIGRLNPDGSVDVNFNTNGTGANTESVYDISLAADGKIFVGGTFTLFNGVARNKVAKLNADGTLDTSFVYTPAQPGSTIIYDVEAQIDGKLLIAGNFTNTTTDTVSRVNPNGSFDTGFTAKIGVSGRVREIVQQTDGKILIVGDFPIVNGVARNSLARLNADGTLDASLVPYFNNLPLTQIIYAVATQPVGSNQGIVLRRLNPDGSQDTSFVTNLFNSSVIYDIAVLPDGKILIAGSFGFFGDQTLGRTVARLNANGSLDTTFNAPQANAEAYRVLAQPDGKVIIGGNFTQIGGIGRGRIARYNADGSLDNSFNPPGGANGSVFDVELQADGKVVIGGAFTQLNGSSAQQRIGRLNADGSLDTSFAQAADSNVNAVKIEPSGKILIGGIFSQVAGTSRNKIARLNPNGSLDTTFNASATLTVLDINLQTDNKILAGGEFTEINNISRVGVARLLNNAAPRSALFDYDGDGRADVSVFRPSTNRWYIFNSSNNLVTETTFGLSGDMTAPADFDGDGKTDIAIFRPSSGDWWYLSSIDNSQKSTHWGVSGDIPRPSDFDGDGKADFVVYRPSDNVWYRFGSTGATSITAFGLSGDKPVSGDFDGDGKSDLAIYRPSTGVWWYLSSIDNSQKAVQWGISSDIPAPADFDGDGKTDFAVYRPSTGVWYIINSSNGSFTIFQFGIAEDKPVPADFDGDGKADIAVFRPSTGTWYQQKSSNGFAAQQFGVSTDIPTENSFVP
jgi:uncharacterized delta-60 repeat protein